MNKFSIIIPCYNAEKYIERCLKSIIKQTYRNFEIIIINDGSTDKSLDIIIFELSADVFICFKDLLRAILSITHILLI